MIFRKLGRYGAGFGLAVLAGAGCGASSDSSGGGEDAATDQSVDSSVAKVVMSGDSTVIDVVKESSPDDSSIDSSFDAADAEAASGDARAAGDSEAAAVCQPIDASTPDPGAVAAGMALVANRACAGCHDGQLTGGIVVPPGAVSKNLTPDPATGLGCWTDEQIVTVILDGVTPEGDTLCVMPKWRNMPLQGKNPLRPDEAAQIVKYLRSLAPVHNEVRPTDCVALGFPKPDAAAEASRPDASDAAIE